MKPKVIKMVKRCESCKGRGFLLQDNDQHGLRIERCDACEKYDCDDTAVQVVFDIVSVAFDAHLAAEEKGYKSV